LGRIPLRTGKKKGDQPVVKYEKNDEAKGENKGLRENARHGRTGRGGRQKREHTSG